MMNAKALATLAAVTIAGISWSASAETAATVESVAPAPVETPLEENEGQGRVLAEVPDVEPGPFPDSTTSVAPVVVKRQFGVQ